MFGMGHKTFELLTVLVESGAALTRAQCDAVCENGIIALERYGFAKHCKACNRYELDKESIALSVGKDSE